MPRLYCPPDVSFVSLAVDIGDDMHLGFYSAAEAEFAFASMMAGRLSHAGRAYLPLRLAPLALASVTAAVGAVVVFIAGFFFLPWWMPITSCLAGVLIEHFTPPRTAFSVGVLLVMVMTTVGVVATLVTFL
jgi:hypothetical protein